MKKAAFGLMIYFLTASFSTKSFESIKKEINFCEQQLKTVADPAERSQYFLRLATAYYQDQEVDKAFKLFLESLDLAPLSPAPIMSAEEEKLYNEALSFYLEQTGFDPFKTAEDLLKRFEETANANPTFLHLNFVVATAYANLGKYDCFFEKFYRSYIFLSDSFLAAKIKGILALRLAQHSFGEEKHIYQESALQLLTIALNKNPRDASLYKVLIFLAKDEKNDALVSTYIQKMIDNKVSISRGDVYLYVREAVSLGEMENAQKIIDHANELYNYSRAITAAQEFLNQNRR